MERVSVLVIACCLAEHSQDLEVENSKDRPVSHTAALHQECGSSLVDGSGSRPPMVLVSSSRLGLQSHLKV